MAFARSSGILLHITSLPGKFGIGDLGPEAYKWVDFLNQTDTRLWQILPLGPTGYGDSPYQCFSAFAGNPYLISPEKLVEEGLLDVKDIEPILGFPRERVDYGQVIPWKLEILQRAYENFRDTHPLKEEFLKFRTSNKNWLDEYVLFMALKEKHEDRPWVEWTPKLRDREETELAKIKSDLSEKVERQAFYQFVFFKQWDALRAYAHQKAVKIIGDVPIYVAHDSADVWGNRELFYLNEEGRQTVVAGVPPDAFSDKGQLWGNPLYRWDIHKERDYSWWIDRMRASFEMVDIVRLDHFRGFAGYWEVPAEHENAIKGRWLPGPGFDLFNALITELGDLAIIAEDLGVITPDVVELIDQLGYPGMRIMPHGFDGNPENTFHPDRYPENAVAYTGTHDNEPLVGWFEHVEQWYRDNLLNYLGTDGGDISWEMIRSLWHTKAVIVVAQLQDLLRLDNSARMNYPSRPNGNWQWRMSGDALTKDLADFLKEINAMSRRSK